MDGTVVLDIDLRASLGHDALDRFAAGSDKRADFLRIDFNCLNPRRVLRKFSARCVERAAHDLENLRPRFFGALDRFGHDLVTDARKFEIELITGDAIVGAAKFEVHVAEMVFGADDVGQKLITFKLSIFALLRDEADRNSGNDSFHGNSGVHEREHSAAHTGHRGRSIRFHDLARNTDRITEIVFVWHNRFERALGQSAVTDFAPARAAGSSRLANAEWRKIVMKNEALRLYAAAVSVDVLRFFYRRQSREREPLCFTALENGRAVRAGNHSNFA